MKITSIFVAAMIMFASVVPMNADEDTTFTYQGRLMDDGAPANGLFDFRFGLFDVETGGTPIDAIPVEDVLVTNGLFTVQLDFGAAAFEDTERWLEILVDQTTLSPRQPLTRAPYSIQTRGINVASDRDVSIGTNIGSHKFQVHTGERARAIYGFNFNVDGNDSKFGVYGRATSEFGYGVYGVHDAPTGTYAGVYGETDSASADAVGVHGVVDVASAGGFSAALRGENRGTATGGIGVYGSHDGQGWGVYGTTEGGLGRGVFGEVLGSGGIAGYFVNDDDIAVLADGVENNGNTAAFQVRSGAQMMYIDGNEIDSNSGVGLHLNNNNNNDVVLAAGGGNVVLPSFSSGLSILQGSVGIGAPAVPIIALRVENGATCILAEKTAGGDNQAAIIGVNRKVNGAAIGVEGISDSPDGFDFYASGAGTNYGSSSSIRWKTNVRNIDEPLEKLARLRGVYYDWDKAHGGHHDVGMIAEEVGAVLPEIVQFEENGIDAIGMDYSKLTPLLVEAVNELHRAHQQQIASLTSDNDALRKRLSNLESLVAEFEAQIAENQK